MLLRARRFPESKKAFEYVLAADPGNRDALNMYAALLSETRETDKADEVLQKLQSLEPDDPEIAVPAGDELPRGAAPRRRPSSVLDDLRTTLATKKADGSEVGQVDGQLAYIAYLREGLRTRHARS